MKGFYNVSKQYLSKLFLLLIIGILINISFAGINTFSFFKNEISAQIPVKAANSQDVLGEIKVMADQALNVEGIIIKKADDLKFNPIIYFSVEGDLARYILHINPILLEENKEYIVRINITGNQNEVINTAKDVFRGKITANYLNKYISEALDIQMSKEYLLNNIAIQSAGGNALQAGDIISGSQSIQLEIEQPFKDKNAETSNIQNDAFETQEDDAQIINSESQEAEGLQQSNNDSS